MTRSNNQLSPPGIHTLADIRDHLSSIFRNNNLDLEEEALFSELPLTRQRHNNLPQYSPLFSPSDLPIDPLIPSSSNSPNNSAPLSPLLPTTLFPQPNIMTIPF